MVYMVVRQSPIYHQMTLDELLFGTNVPGLLNKNESNTRTFVVNDVKEKYLDKVDVKLLIHKLESFNLHTEELHNVSPRSKLYDEFYIPKKSGGLRHICAPKSELMNALRELKGIFENDFNALYHTSAFAYIKNRCTVDAIKRHQSNKSRWFAKYDLSNFFGSTTLEFVLKMFSMVFPFSEVMKTEKGRDELIHALDLAFLDGGLPQGTPISPIITNVMMIPIDHQLYNGFRKFKYLKNNEEHENYCVYTRYADDFHVSSRYDFSFKQAEKYIVDVLKMFDAPFTINSRKTRYGSSSGSNWNLGVMLNANNDITIGHKKKKQFKAMISSYAMDRRNGIQWSKSDIQTMEGHRNYYRMVEKDSIDGIMDHLSKKFCMNIVECIKEDLKNG